MTPEQHNKYLAWSHIAYGGIFFLLMALFLIFFGAVFIAAAMADPTAPPVFLFILVWVFIAAIYAAMTIPSFIAGYGLLKQKKWARTWSIISAVVASMNFPFGTAVTVYTLWFVFSEPGKLLYDQNHALPGSSRWAIDSAQRERENQYHPPLPPPDWR